MVLAIYLPTLELVIARFTFRFIPVRFILPSNELVICFVKSCAELQVAGLMAVLLVIVYRSLKSSWENIIKEMEAEAEVHRYKDQ